MILPRVVLPENQLDLREDPTLAIKSMLVELGFDRAYDFVDQLTAVVKQGNFQSYLLLPLYLGDVSLAVAAHIFAYQLQLISKERLALGVYAVLPAYTSGINEVMSYIALLEKDEGASLFEYFGLSQEDPLTFLEQPKAYLDWIDANYTLLEDYTAAFRSKDCFGVLLAVLKRNVSPRLQPSARAKAELKHWVGVSYFETVMGADYVQYV